MHSSETLPAPPTTGPGLLLQLGRLIIRARSASPATRAPRDRLLHAKLLAAKPSTSQQVHVQPKESEEPKPGVEAQLSNHVHALWNEQIPLCIEVLLTPDCPSCYSALSRVEEEGTFDKQHAHQRALLLERWTMRAQVNKSHDSTAFISPQWLLNAVRSQLHFSQLSAWYARLKETKTEENTTERRRKLSRETCNYKKLEANCDETELTEDLRKLNIVYSIKIPGESYNMAEFVKPPTDHNFPVTDLGSDVYIKVVLQSLPRIEDIPIVKCSCAPKRRTSKEIPTITHEELVGKLNDLSIRPQYDGAGTNVVDDRMLTPCSENGKHKCNCDDESDSQKPTNQPKKLDERRLKEIAKYKRRLRKESKMRKLCDSTSSEGDGLQKKETRTSIPILQAARFDRFRAIGCYRNQTYLTLPASKIETKSPFIETVSVPDTEYKRTNTVATQTDDLICDCGNTLEIDDSERKMVRSEATYNLASLDQSEVLLDAINKCQENGARRKFDDGDDDKSLKKHKCDNSLVCDSVNDNISVPIVKDDIIKRPKFRRIFPIVDRINEIVSDRYNAERDIKDLHLKSDDTVFSGPKDTKRQKTYSVGDDNYVCYEKCDYGSFDNCEFESPKDEKDFMFPDAKKGVDNQIPSPSEMDRFRWRFDSAASMVFHSKTGLPLTSSPAPLRRGNNCFDFDDSINGISGIKSALFHPISSPPSPPCPPSPPSPRPAPPARRPASAAPPPPLAEQPTPKLRIGPSAGLLGSFEESALKGRLEPVATVHGFTAELGASGAFCPPHKRLPVTVFFYAPGGTNAPYMGHINLGTSGYRVSRSGTIQVSLLNPHGTLVKMFVVLYDLTSMPPAARTFLRQRTLYMPAGAAPPTHSYNKWLRYLIHLRFMTSKSGKLYLHTDIRIIVSRKADLDTATAHSALFQPIPNQPTNGSEDDVSTNQRAERTPNRVFGGCGDYSGNKSPEICYGNPNGVSYELRSFTYAPENPKYSPR